jgi:spermidine synthase
LTKQQNRKTIFNPMDALNNLGASLGVTPAELIFGLLACLLAIFLGVHLAKTQARAFKGPALDASDALAGTQGHLPPVTFADYGDMRFLHLGTPWVQGSMKISHPYEIHLEYVQRMMGWMLFTDLDRISHLRAMQLGLGAAALTKFCHHHLAMHTTAVELNPQVVTACRKWFNLPADNEKLQVLIADAAELTQSEAWFEKIDVLQVDLYDQNAAMPALDSEAFYQGCKQLLTHTGCMTVNLYGRESNLELSMQTIARVFGADAVWAFKPTSSGNTVALAFREPPQIDKATLQLRGKMIESRWPLPAMKWPEALAPRH